VTLAGRRYRRNHISKTAAFPNHSNRFHTLFDLPKRVGRARQAMMQRFQKQPIVYLGASRLPIQFPHCRGHADPPNQSAIHIHIESQRGTPNHVPESTRHTAQENING
jgi:hypothetical protein